MVTMNCVFLQPRKLARLSQLMVCFTGCKLVQVGPVPPTGKSIAADYVYAMVFEGNRIQHMTKIWNDTVSMQQLGWS